MNSLVSTIIPVFNRPAQLREAVASVLNQHYSDLELVIVDDGSTDSTPEVIRDLTADSRIRSVRIDNSGPGLAREAGRAIARGAFIQYLDSDDVLYPDKFSRQVKVLAENPECDVVYCGTAYRMADGSLREEFPEKRTRETFVEMWPSFLVSRWWNTLTPLYRRSVCDQVGPWSDLCQEEDWEYDCRVASAGGRLCQVDEVLCEFRHHEGPRASGTGLPSLTRLQHRARARSLIFAHAQRAGLNAELPEMQHFARSAFLLARQCGAAGLKSESSRLYQLSRQAAGAHVAMDQHLYGLMANLLGWSNMGRLGAWFDRMRK